jgi:hypothetical protein
MKMNTETQRQLEAAHAELTTIHEIGMCIAECPPISDSDTMTVKMVKEMAIRLKKKTC